MRNKQQLALSITLVKVNHSLHKITQFNRSLAPKQIFKKPHPHRKIAGYESVSVLMKPFTNLKLVSISQSNFNSIKSEINKIQVLPDDKFKVSGKTTALLYQQPNRSIQYDSIRGKISYKDINKVNSVYTY